MLKTLKQLFQLLTPSQRMGVLAMLALASVVSIFTTWRLSIFSM